MKIEMLKTNRTEANKSESSNGDSNNSKSGRWDGNANKKTQSKNFSKKSETKNKIYILNDSMVKHMKGWDLSAKLDHRHNVYVRNFPGAKLRREGLFYYYYFFSIWVFFHEHSQITGQQGKEKGHFLTPGYHFHPLHRHFDIGWASAAGSLPLRIASSRGRTENLCFPSPSR